VDQLSGWSEGLGKGALRVSGVSVDEGTECRVPADRKKAISRIINPQTVNKPPSNITSVMYFDLDDCPVNTLRHARFNNIHVLLRSLIDERPLIRWQRHLARDFDSHSDPCRCCVSVEIPPPKSVPYRPHLISGFTTDGRLQQHQVRLFFNHHLNRRQ
jgi:hypothetical protein